MSIYLLIESEVLLCALAWMTNRMITAYRIILIWKACTGGCPVTQVDMEVHTEVDIVDSLPMDPTTPTPLLTVHIPSTSSLFPIQPLK